MKAAAHNDTIRGIVMMNPSLSTASDPVTRLESLKTIAARSRWSDDYLDLVTRTVDETEAKASSTKGSWLYILGKKCFMSNVRDEMADRPLETIRKIGMPVLILQGGNDDDVPGTSASYIDKALADAGNQARTVTYYAYLGQFLGDAVNDGSIACIMKPINRSLRTRMPGC